MLGWGEEKRGEKDAREEGEQNKNGSKRRGE